MSILTQLSLPILHGPYWENCSLQTPWEGDMVGEAGACSEIISHLIQTFNLNNKYLKCDCARMLHEQSLHIYTCPLVKFEQNQFNCVSKVCPDLNICHISRHKWHPTRQSRDNAKDSKAKLLWLYVHHKVVLSSNKDLNPSVSWTCSTFLQSN